VPAAFQLEVTAAPVEQAEQAEQAALATSAVPGSAISAAPAVARLRPAARWPAQPVLQRAAQAARVEQELAAQAERADLAALEVPAR
jgi:hypothetical protein